MTIITIKDVAAAGYCGLGARRWFESYGFDFRDFIQNGIAEDKFLATNDAMAIRVATLKRERDANG